MALPLSGHGGYKLLSLVGLDLGRSSGFFESPGATLGPFAAYFFGMAQFVTGALIGVGFGTRPAALVACAFLIASVLLHLPGGLSIIEYPLVLVGATAAIMLKGGGEHSLDRRLGAEL